MEFKEIQMISLLNMKGIWLLRVSPVLFIIFNLSWLRKHLKNWHMAKLVVWMKCEMVFFRI